MPEILGVSGLTEIRQTLLKLPEAVQGRASQSALAKAAAPIVRLAKSLAPRRASRELVGPLPGGQDAPPGLLRKSIRAFRNRNSTKSYESRFIGVRGKAWYWKFIEFGRGAITSAKSLGTQAKGFFGKAVKAVPARPFLRPAFEALKSQAIEIYRKALVPEVEKYAQRAYQRSIRRITRKVTGF